MDTANLLQLRSDSSSNNGNLKNGLKSKLKKRRDDKKLRKLKQGVVIDGFMSGSESQDMIID